MIFIILLIIIGVGVFWYITTRNSLISLEERLKNAKSQIAVQIESRWDALSNLIQATQKYSDYEKDTIKEVVAARTRVSPSSAISDIQKSDADYNRAMTSIMALSERYPELKASEVYKDTMASVNKFEDNVRYARMSFNDMATKYNRTIKAVPTNIIANQLGLMPSEYFQGTESKQEMPQWGWE